jgi:glycerol-3-phosphate acyltransferase PlsY
MGPATVSSACVDIAALIQALVLVVGAYLVGSLPMGVIVARLTGGRDPRTVGSGRTGGTNALRAMGPARAGLVAVLDVAKGAVPILVARWVGASDLVGAVTGLAAVTGAWRSVFLHFHGGRGVATGVGGMLAVSPAIVLIGLPVFVLVIAFTRYVSLGSLLGVASGALVSVVFVVLGWLPAAWLVYTIPGTALVWYAHRDNIQRLLAGTERRFDPAERATETRQSR